MTLNHKKFSRHSQKLKHLDQAYLKPFHVFSSNEKKINFNYFLDVFPGL